MLERSFRKHPDLREALDNPILKSKYIFSAWFAHTKDYSTQTLYPVSYTHLDVYKRQLMESMTKTDGKSLILLPCRGNDSNSE